MEPAEAFETQVGEKGLWSKHRPPPGKALGLKDAVTAGASSFTQPLHAARLGFLTAWWSQDSSAAHMRAGLQEGVLRETQQKHKSDHLEDKQCHFHHILLVKS